MFLDSFFDSFEHSFEKSPEGSVDRKNIGVIIHKNPNSVMK